MATADRISYNASARTSTRKSTKKVVRTPMGSTKLDRSRTSLINTPKVGSRTAAKSISGGPVRVFKSPPSLAQKKMAQKKVNRAVTARYTAMAKKKK
jgi:hypothetical protein